VQQKEPIKDLFVLVRQIGLFLQFLSVNLPLLLSSMRLFLLKRLWISSLPDLDHAIQIGYFHLHRFSIALARCVAAHRPLLLHAILVNLSLEVLWVAFAARNQRASA